MPDRQHGLLNAARYTRKTTREGVRLSPSRHTRASSNTLYRPPTGRTDKDAKVLPALPSNTGGAQALSPASDKYATEVPHEHTDDASRIRPHAWPEPHPDQ